MPEGDTIHRTANRLRPALAGQDLVRFEAPRLVGDRPRLGTRIEAVEAVGKHLLIDFADGLTLQTHQRMSGSWHLYRTGERWRSPRHLMRALVVVDGWEAVDFAAPVVRTYRRDAPGGASGRELDPVAHLGPDLCLAEPDLDGCLVRWAALVDPATQVADVLLDQRVACGVGNVYKSEVLHACRVDPFAPALALDEPLRRALLETAARLLHLNLTTTRRTTTGGPAGALAVYGRAHRPCPRCGTPVRVRRQGAQARSTYWCPACQPPFGAPAPA